MHRHHIVLLGMGGDFWVGGREYTRNLIQALLSLPKDERESFELSVLANGEREIAYYEAFRPHLKVLGNLNELPAPYSLVNRARWLARRMLGSSINPRLQDYLVSIETTFAYPALTAAADKQPFRSAQWIADFQYRHVPQGSNPIEIAGRKAEFARFAKFAQHVVLSSHHAKKDFSDVFPAAAHKAVVLQFRASLDDESWPRSHNDVVQKYNLPERFLLVSNLLAPNKNHLLVLSALHLLKARNVQITVAFTGDIYDYRNPGYYNRFLAQVHELGVHDRVRVLGLVPRGDQIQLMRACAAVVQPSLFEGWHTGVEEARLIGKTLVLSDIPVHREQAPPNRLFFDPTDAAQLANAMQEAFDGFSGFDLERESAARNSYAALRNDYARAFLSLAGVELARTTPRVTESTC